METDLKQILNSIDDIDIQDSLKLIKIISDNYMEKNKSKHTKCSNCLADIIDCRFCCDNPIYEEIKHYSNYTPYIPVCPYGYEDCVYDPAYIKHSSPDYYLEHFGEITPEEAIKQTCKRDLIEMVDGEYLCNDYDDENK